MIYFNITKTLLLVACYFSSNLVAMHEIKILKQEEAILSLTNSHSITEELMKSLQSSCPKQLAEMITLVQDQKDLKAWSFPKHILLIGTSGAGKTLRGKALAQTVGLPIFFYDAVKLTQDFVASKGQSLLAVFKRASDLNKPCVVMIDGLECLNEVHVEMLNKLSGLLATIRKDRIIFIGTTSQFTKFPATFQEYFKEFSVEIPLPDEAQRVDIITHFIQPRKNASFNVDIICQTLANKTDKFSPRDLELMIEKAILLASKRSSTTVTMQDCLAALDSMKKETPALQEDTLGKKAKRWGPTAAVVTGTAAAAYILYTRPAVRYHIFSTIQQRGPRAAFEIAKYYLQNKQAPSKGDDSSDDEA